MMHSSDATMSPAVEQIWRADFWKRLRGLHARHRTNVTRRRCQRRCWKLPTDAWTTFRS